MKEVRIHGRGGQGSLVLAQFMAIAALEDGKYGQAFPFLGGGGERRGKAIMAFCRLDDIPIRIRCRVDEPDFLIIQDPTIISEIDVTSGLRQGGLILVNTDKEPSALGLSTALSQIFTISADEMARSILGSPIINTALLGAFSGLTKTLTLDATLKAVMKRFPGDLGQKNALIVKESYERMVERLS